AEGVQGGSSSLRGRDDSCHNKSRSSDVDCRAGCGGTGGCGDSSRLGCPSGGQLPGKSKGKGSGMVGGSAGYGNGPCIPASWGAFHLGWMALHLRCACRIGS